MAYSGQVLENPIGGEGIVFRETASDSAAELLAFELFLALYGYVPGIRVHTKQEECFEVVGGN